MEESLDQALTIQYQGLCMSVGHLFITFARLEGVLSSMLKLHLAFDMGEMTSQRKVAKASAIYGSMRFTAARDTINRIAATEKVPVETLAFVANVFAHAGHIQNLRDKIAHHHVVPVPDGTPNCWEITDAITTRDIRNPKTYVIATSSITDAANDLNTIATRLGGEVLSGHILSSAEGDTRPISWLYKPSMLKLVRQKSASTPR